MYPFKICSGAMTQADVPTNAQNNTIIDPPSAGSSRLSKYATHPVPPEKWHAIYELDTELRLKRVSFPRGFACHPKSCYYAATNQDSR